MVTLLPNQYLSHMELNIKVFNWAPVIMFIVGIFCLIYWKAYGKYNSTKH